MKRIGFTMKLKPGFEKEYKKRHDEIWAELSEEIKNAGIYDYSIFLDEETLTLFAVQKVKDENTTHLLPQKKVMKKWWDYMKDLMETNHDSSPVVKNLTEVFHLD